MKKYNNLNTKTSDLIIRPKSLTVRFKSYGPRNRLPKARVRRYRQRLHVDVHTWRKWRRNKVVARRKARDELKQETFRVSWAGLGRIRPGLAGSGLGRCWLAWAGRVWAARLVRAWVRRTWVRRTRGSPELGWPELGQRGGGKRKRRKEKEKEMREERERRGRREERERKVFRFSVGFKSRFYSVSVFFSEKIFVRRNLRIYP